MKPNIFPVYMIVVLFFLACAIIQEKKDSGAEECDLVSEVVHLKNQTVTLPGSGLFVLESHLATTEDIFPNGRAFPGESAEGIENHLAHSSKLAGLSQATLYPTRYHREWTPPEGGLYGQGSVGALKPTPEEEMNSGNMFWSGKPPGDKWLVTYAGRSVVVLMKFETGPRDPAYLGGLQSEVFAELGASDTSKISIGRLKNQSLPLGKVECK